MSKEKFNRKHIDKIKDIGNRELVLALWLNFGSDGIVVVQRAMLKLGDSIEDDGWFGKTSRLALKSFNTNELNEAIGEVLGNMGLDDVVDIPVSDFNLDAKLKVLFPSSPKNARRVFARIWNKYREAFGIINDFQQNAFLAQMREELGSTLRPKAENLNYRCKALVKLFSYFRRNPKEAYKYGRCNGHKANQRAIANRVYANRIGNGNVASGDGWKFRGQGVLQLTGKGNYKEILDVINKTLGYNKYTVEEFTKEIGTDQETGILSAFAFYKVNKMAKAKNVNAMTKIVNRYTHSYTQRKAFYSSIIHV